jgi:hypothetical protein
MIGIDPLAHRSRVAERRQRRINPAASRRRLGGQFGSATSAENFSLEARYVLVVT